MKLLQYFIVPLLTDFLSSSMTAPFQISVNELSNILPILIGNQSWHTQAKHSPFTSIVKTSKGDGRFTIKSGYTKSMNKNDYYSNKIKIKDKSVFDDKTVSDDYKTGGAYKAILKLFATQLDDEKFAAHCKKFFKGDNENNT